MKQQNHRFYQGLLGFVWISFAVCTGGCNTSEHAEFKTVAGHLDSGGSYYCISDNTCLYRTARSFFKSFEKALHSGAEESQKQELLTLVPQLELLVRLSGISECKWTGASSRRIPNAIEEMYQNKHFYLLPQSPKGILWKLPGEKNRPVLQEMAELPADTALAGDFILDLRSAGKTLAESMWGKENIEPLVKAWLQIGVEEFFDGISGEWGFAAFNIPGTDKKMDFVLTFPDKKQRVFKKLSLFLKNLPGSTLKGNDLYWKSQDGNVYSCTGADERIMFYSSARAKKKFLFSKTKLASQPDFKRLSWQIPTDGLAIFYFAGTQPETSPIILPKILGGGEWDPAQIDRPQLFVIRKEKEGLSITANSSFDVPAENVVDFAFLPAMLLIAYWEDLSPYSEAIPSLQKKAPKQPVKKTHLTQKQILGKCKGNMAKIAAALKAYAAANKGKYPVDLDLAGIKQLLSSKKISLKDLVCPGSSDKAVETADLLDFNSCSYIYLGAWPESSNAKLPLLIDRPGNHLNCF